MRIINTVSFAIIILLLFLVLSEAADILGNKTKEFFDTLIILKGQ